MLKKSSFSLLFILTCFFAPLFSAYPYFPTKDTKTVFLAIVAKNHAHHLPLFFYRLENLEYDKKLITIYINTSSNKDKTKQLLQDWAEAHKDDFCQIIFESEDEEENKKIENTKTENTNMAKLKNRSLQKAIESKCDYYFLVSCHAFLKRCTLRELISKDKPIVAPLLKARPMPMEANFFYDVTVDGFNKDHESYFKILNYEVVGTFKVPLVHSAYLIKAEVLNKLSYLDETEDNDYIVFSRNARKNNVDQYISNERDFGDQVNINGPFRVQYLHRN